MYITVRIARWAYLCYSHKIFRMGGGNRIFKAFNRLLFSCDIAYQINLPASTKLPHNGLGVVIHPSVQIGEHCIIHQNVTIGAKGKPGFGNEAPIIGNNVMIGAGAVVLGKIIIGNNAIIGANAVVLKNVPEGAMVAGVPAEVKYIIEKK